MRNILQTPVSFIKNTSIRNKLLLSYFILILLPLLILTVLSHSRSARVVEKNMVDLANRSMEQLNRDLSGRIDGINRVADILFKNNDVQNILVKNPDAYPMNEQLEDIERLTVLVQSLENNTSIYRIKLYVNNKMMLSNENINFYSMEPMKSSDWYTHVFPHNKGTHWSSLHSFKYGGMSEERRIVSAIHPLFDFKNYNKLIGIVSIDVLAGTLQDLLKGTNIAKDAVSCLVDEEDRIFVSSDDVLLQENYGGLEKYMDTRREGEDWDKVKIANHEVLVRSMRVGNTGWKLGVVIPYAEILNPGSTLLNYTLLWMAVIGFIAYGVAYYISFSISRRFQRLIKTMQQAQTGQLDVKLVSNPKDEVGEIENNFNFMLEEIKLLVDERYRMGKEIKNAELKALQAQINPHFLYNTLDLINWRANRYKAEDIQFVVNSLATFYKLSLSKGKDIVSIADEIEHVKAYVDIQKMRFRDSIHLDILVEEEVLQYSIMKLVLQPLVENAILHGILGTPRKQGNITITGRVLGDQISISVEDDGAGMDVNQLNAVFEEGITRETHGYGIKNIHERLKIYYGEEYGLRYGSEPGKGTTAEIRVPARKYVYG